MCHGKHRRSQNAVLVTHIEGRQLKRNSDSHHELSFNKKKLLLKEIIRSCMGRILSLKSSSLWLEKPCFHKTLISPEVYNCHYARAYWELRLW